MPPCSGQSRPSPAGGREDAASLDRPCARRLRELAVGMEECSRRGSNQRMRPKRARKPTISNRWFSGNFRLALTVKLGGFYSKGRSGLPKDDREAARLFKLAADQGNAFAQVYLGRFYALGRGGLPKDDCEAARLYKLAADQGHAYGQESLGFFYSE